MIGIAVAFYLGFKNNSSYDRTWEARKIWGEIMNNSRSFGASVCSFVNGINSEEIKRELIYRHTAWLTALRYQLRLSKEWEHTDRRLNKLFSASVCESYNQKLDSDFLKFLSPVEVAKYNCNTNIATQIMRNQSERLQELKNQNYFEDFRHMELHHLITEFFNGQGKSERIKTFPFPRQSASTALWLSFVFAFLVPFGMLDIFKDMTNWMYWITPILSALVIWVFFFMEKIGDYSENPFEGTYNDVPVTAISRTIEIDLREMINDENISEPIKAENGFLL